MNKCHKKNVSILVIFEEKSYVNPLKTIFSYRIKKKTWKEQTSNSAKAIQNLFNVNACSRTGNIGTEGAINLYDMRANLVQSFCPFLSCKKFR